MNYFKRTFLKLLKPRPRTINMSKPLSDNPYDIKLTYINFEFYSEAENRGYNQFEARIKIWKIRYDVDKVLKKIMDNVHDNEKKLNRNNK
jgi:hypothetical protein